MLLELRMRSVESWLCYSYNHCMYIYIYLRRYTPFKLFSFSASWFPRQSTGVMAVNSCISSIVDTVFSSCFRQYMCRVLLDWVHEWNFEISERTFRAFEGLFHISSAAYRHVLIHRISFSQRDDEQPSISSRVPWKHAHSSRGPEINNLSIENGL